MTREEINQELQSLLNTSGGDKISGAELRTGIRTILDYIDMQTGRDLLEQLLAETRATNSYLHDAGREATDAEFRPLGVRGAAFNMSNTSVTQTALPGYDASGVVWYKVITTHTTNGIETSTTKYQSAMGTQTYEPNNFRFGAPPINIPADTPQSTLSVVESVHEGVDEQDTRWDMVVRIFYVFNPATNTTVEQKRETLYTNGNVTTSAKPTGFKLAACVAQDNGGGDTPTPTPTNFDVTADWAGRSVTDVGSFKIWLEGKGMSNVGVTDFSLIEGRLKANVTGDLPVGVYGELYLNMNSFGITDVQAIDIAGLQRLNLSTNQLSSFDPSQPLPAGLQSLDLRNNQLSSFDPSQPLPAGLQRLDLGANQLSSFDPSQPLPAGLQTLDLNNNPLTNFDLSHPLPAGLQWLSLNNNLLSSFDPSQPVPAGLQWLGLEGNWISDWELLEPFANAAPWTNATVSTTGNSTSAEGTNFEAILQSKGWTVEV